jgi:hypothetical protein
MKTLIAITVAAAMLASTASAQTSEAGKITTSALACKYPRATS